MTKFITSENKMTSRIILRYGSLILCGMAFGACIPEEDTQDKMIPGFLMGQATNPSGSSSSNPNSFFAWLSANQTGAASGTGTAIMFDREDYDTGSDFTAAGKLQPTASGKWQMTCFFGFLAAENSKYCNAYIQRTSGDKTMHGPRTWMSSGAANCQSAVTAIVDVLAGEIYECGVQHDMTGSQTIAGGGFSVSNASARWHGFRLGN